MKENKTNAHLEQIQKDLDGEKNASDFEKDINKQAEKDKTMGDFVSNIFELPKFDELFKNKSKIAVLIEYVKFEQTGFGEQMIISVKGQEYHTGSRTLIPQFHEALQNIQTPCIAKMQIKTGALGDYYTLIT